MFDSFLAKTAAPKDRRLPQEEELKLLEKYQKTGDMKSFKRLKMSLRTLLYDLANKAKPAGNEIDIHQLMFRIDGELPKLLRNYNPNGGTALNTYLTANIKPLLNNAVKENVIGPHVPRTERGGLFQYQQAFQQAKMELGPNVNDEDVLKFMPEDKTIDDLQRAKKYNTVSLVGDQLFSKSKEDSSVAFKDQFLPDNFSSEDRVNDMRMMHVKEVMNRRLNPEDRRIIEEWAFNNKTMAEIALSLGLTSSQVRQTIKTWKTIVKEEGVK